MNELLLFLVSHLDFLYLRYGFQFVSSGSSAASFGDAFVVLERETLQLRLVRNRGQLTLEFRHKKRGGWFSLGVVRCHMRGGREFFEFIDRDDNVSFVQKNIDEIIATFSSERVKAYIEALKSLEKKKKKAIFYS